jgi:prepilin-type N-terminal cleavage/methylation domain-containing protein
MMERMLQKLSGEDKNFPLIELMVVIAAVGILVTIALQKLLAH